MRRERGEKGGVPWAAAGRLFRRRKDFKGGAPFKSVSTEKKGLGRMGKRGGLEFGVAKGRVLTNPVGRKTLKWKRKEKETFHRKGIRGRNIQQKPQQGTIPYREEKEETCANREKQADGPDHMTENTMNVPWWGWVISRFSKEKARQNWGRT